MKDGTPLIAKVDGKMIFTVYRETCAHSDAYDPAIHSWQTHRPHCGCQACWDKWLALHPEDKDKIQHIKP